MMSFRRRRPGGFSLIEAMVVVTILGIIISLGLPTFRTWIQNVRIRSTTESMYNGLLIARGEAIKNNTTACFFSLPDPGGVDTNGASWCVRRGPNTGIEDCGDANEITRAVSSYLETASVTIPVGALPVCFTGSGARPLGSVQTNFQVQLGALAGAVTDVHRTLQVRVSPMGQTRTCDINLPATDPRSC